MENSNAPSTKGKGLGMAGMIIGIVCAVLALIPGVAIFVSWIALLGFILSLVGFMQAKKGGNPKKGVMITGMVLNILVLIAAVIYGYIVAQAVVDGASQFEEALKNIDTTNM